MILQISKEKLKLQILNTIKQKKLYKVFDFTLIFIFICFLIKIS